MFRSLAKAVVATLLLFTADAADLSPEDLLSLGDRSLASDNYNDAIENYELGIASILKGGEISLITLISLRTNLGTALATVGRKEDAIESYRRGLLTFNDEIDDIVDVDVKKDVTNIASQASFFLGMEYQETGRSQKAADAYAFANTLDPLHWSSLANLGSVLHDELKQHGDALLAYNKAYEILTDSDTEPTDPPAEPRFILSQLQYRMGLAIIYDPNRKCALMDAPDKEVPCKEMAAHAFSMAIKYDDKNEAAKHMLATVTADATVTRASNDYVKDLFDEYAHNFEHSLVDELGYTGYERLRRGFDSAFGGQEFVPVFELVVDAGCGTGLVGEQFRNVSKYLIGVDLSQAILDEAIKARPNLYDEVREGDVTEFFREKKPISLIIAADSYIYFGDLDPLFESMNDGLGENSYAAFTLENVDKQSEKSLEETKPDWRWQLTASGRFAHRKDYVVATGKKHDLKVVHYETLDNFRYENGKGVRGHIFIMQKIEQKNNSGYVDGDEQEL